MGIMSIRIQGERAPKPLVPASRTITPPAPAAEPERPSAFARILNGIGNEATRGEKTVLQAVRASGAGRDPSPTELLVLQANIYRYSEVVDLASKLVDRAASAAKTVLSGQ